MITDAWLADKQLARNDYKHTVVDVPEFGQPAHEVLPRVHRVASLLKRWLLGTRQGALSAEHLDFHLDWFTFPFNRRKSKARGLVFYRLVEQAVSTPPQPYKRLRGGKPV